MDSNMDFNCSTLQCIFSYLNWQELLKVSKVNDSWKCKAMDLILWQTIDLRETMVQDWFEFFNLIDVQEVKSLTTSGMLLPSKDEDLNVFWRQFSLAIPSATKLEALEISNCPTYVVSDVLGSLHKLQKFYAFSVMNPTGRENPEYSYNIFNEPLDMKYVRDMVHLRELRISGETEEIDLSFWPLLTFSRLTKLKTLSLTSIRDFSSDLFASWDITIPNLEVLEIGNCTYLYKDYRYTTPPTFPVFLKKLTNLRSLRLVKCYGKYWKPISKEVFDAIRSLKKLKKLELINIKFNDNLAQQLAKCGGITSLLIIPTYDKKNEILHHHLLDCLNKLSKSLTHVVWGLTYELDERNPCNNKLIIRSRQQNQKSVNMGSVTSLKNFLDFMMLNVKTKVIKIPHQAINGVYLSEEFDDL